MQIARIALKSAFLVIVTSLCATRMSYTQGVDPTVGHPFPAGSALINIGPNSDSDMTMGGEYKSTKNVITPEEQPQKWWSVTAEIGYSSEYIFRGTNLTPNSDGIEFQEVYVSAKGFTLGFWFATQLGDAVVPGATATGESGSGTSPFNFNVGYASALDTAIQRKFHELDLFLAYSHSFGPIDVTIGNIAFLIYRNQTDRFAFEFFGEPVVTNYPSLDNEQFDRLYLALSTRIIHFGRVTITPTVTYYQTIYNEAEDIKGTNGPSDLGYSQDQYFLNILAFKRNDQLGGYLEGKVQAVIPIIGDVLRLEPIALISYSFKDRSEAVPITPSFIIGKTSSSRPLTGFNHFQAGAELVLQITRYLSVTGFGDYAYHIADPVGGTDKNEWWGGGKVTVSF